MSGNENKNLSLTRLYSNAEKEPASMYALGKAASPAGAVEGTKPRELGSRSFVCVEPCTVGRQTQALRHETEVRGEHSTRNLGSDC